MSARPIIIISIDRPSSFVMIVHRSRPPSCSRILTSAISLVLSKRQEDVGVCACKCDWWLAVFKPYTLHYMHFSSSSQWSRRPKRKGLIGWYILFFCNSRMRTRSYQPINPLLEITIFCYFVSSESVVMDWAEHSASFRQQAHRAGSESSDSFSCAQKLIRSQFPKPALSP